ncbi:MAG: DUF58 domain-containing protein [Bacteroidales bacterium]|nr:DUF58 domain-containing protein [Bacteroidales bacterium]
MLREQASRYSTLDFLARQVVEGFIVGRHRSPFHGYSAEFSDYRQYNDGESTRNIDWHLYARTDRLYVKQFEEETNLRCRIVVDNSGSMLFPTDGHADFVSPNKLTFAALAATVLVEVLYRQRDAFGLTLVADGIGLSTPCRSSAAHRRHIVGELEKLVQPLSLPASEPHSTGIAQSLHIMAEAMHRRSLVVIFTDAFVGDGEQELLFDALRHLRHNKHEVILFHTYHRRHEMNLDYGTAPVRFIDLENGRVLKLQPQDVAEKYSLEMNKQRNLLQQRAMQYNIDYVAVDVEQGCEQVLTPFLLRRSKM